MRIAHIITRMIVGGAQENTLLCCRDLVDLHGDEVLLITGPALGPEGDLLAQAGMGENDRPPDSNPSTGQGRGGRLQVAMIPQLRRAIHPSRDWRSYREIQRLLVEFRPDVAHTHSAKGGLLGRAAAHALGVPAIVHTVHGAPFHPYQNFLAREFFRRCEKYAAGKCHQLVSVADAMTDLLVDAGVAPREKFITVSSGMDVEPFLAADDHRLRVRRELGFADEDIVVGKIARLFHLKGHEYVIRAAKRAVQKAPRVRFLFVGDGLLRADLERQIAEAGLTDRFRFTGLVPPGRIPELLGAMDVLVHASFREGLARALPQALIAGKPIISYDVDGAREVAIPGETGFLLPPASVDEMAAAIVDLALNPEKRARYGSAGRARFTDQFRHQTMTHRLREIYERLLANCRRGDA